MDLSQILKLDDPLINLATVLVCGIIGGEVFARIKLPKVTGWIATGIILRQMDLPGMSSVATQDLVRPFMGFVLGFIAFTVGATLYIRSLRNTQKRILLLLLGEAIITPILVWLVLNFVGPHLSSATTKMSTQAAILLAAIAIAGAPGTTVLVIQEARARGTLTRTLIAAIGLIDMVAVGIFVFVSTIQSGNADLLASFSKVGVQFFATFMIGGCCAIFALFLNRTIVSPAFLGPTMVAVILGSWGGAAAFGTSGGILACTFAGIVVTNVQHDVVRSAEAYLNSIGGVLFATFFTLAGTRLDFGLVPAAFGLVILYFLARLIGKTVSAFTAMTVAGMTKNVRNFLGLALLPHGGVAVGLILVVGADSSGFSEEVRATVTTVGLAALAINQLIGPSATRFSLIRAGEDHKDRPQLLDFLQEHRIQVGLDGQNKDEVVRKLTGLLYSTSNLKVEQEEFVKRVLERDQQETTCLGKGLMIPHAILEEGEEVTGVLGLSPKGLDLGAPDGRLVHAVLLLATPEKDRNRHLQVISAFASFITRDVNYAEQLYHARSAAHAYDVLHHDDQEDLNYFLEDAAERAGLREEELSQASA